MREWHASWIGPAYDPREDLGLFVFRTEFELPEKPKSLIVRVSADQQYSLFVNDGWIDWGPARGDTRHWYYREIDIRPFLRTGTNVIHALVWNFGWMAPMAQQSVRTGFLLEADAPFEFLSTPGDWQVAKCEWHRFEMMGDAIGDFYIDVGPGEVSSDLTSLETQPDWKKPNLISRAEDRGYPGGGVAWSLIKCDQRPTCGGIRIAPRRLIVRKRDSSGQRMQNSGRTLAEEVLTLRADEELIIDAGELMAAYPVIVFQTVDQSISEIRITYSESPFGIDGVKGNRSDISGKSIRGYQDVVRTDSTGFGTLEPLWWRTFRYIKIKANRSIKVFPIQFDRVGTSLDVQASFSSHHPKTQPIWDICIRTLKLCAIDTYFDCPYYEQLQYIGDTRLQALIGYYLSRDRHLQRKAIEQFHWSILENGLTQSRYPSRQMQVIPPFSLWWVVMLYDAWMHDPEFDPAPYLHSAEGVLKAYQRILDGNLEPFWCFGDWVPGWKWGIPPGGPHAEMHLILLEIAKWALAQLKESDFALKRPARPADQPVTEHAEALWRYGQVISGQEPDPWEEAELDGTARCTYFWQYVKHVGLQPHDYMSLMGPWREMLELGLTTTPENPEPTRSDCHGWSAHPPLGFLQLVAGVTSIAPGWSKARIQPRPGSIESFDALIPHPSGDLSVKLDKAGLSVNCPVPFELVWQDRSGEYPAGEYQFRAPN